MSEKDRILKEADRIVDVPANLHQKIAHISGELGAIQKDSTAPDAMGGFMFLSHGVLMGHLRNKLSEANVTIWESLHIVSDEQVTMRTSKGERDARRVVVRLEVTFVNGDDPEQQVDVVWHGEGLDSTDKAMQKAATSAEKYLLFKTFKVSDKDDPDGAEVDGADKPGVASAPPAQPNPRFQQLVKDVAHKADPPSSLTRGQAAPGPVPSPPPSLSRGPANAPVPGTPKSSGNMLTLQRPAKGQPAAATEPVAPSQDGEASDIELRTELLTRAMTAAQEMSSENLDELQAFKAAEQYLDKLSQTNWGKSYASLTQKQLSGLIVFFREKFGKAEEA